MKQLYFKPRVIQDSVKIPPVQDGLLSDELYDKILQKQKDNPGRESTQWIFLSDAVSRGTITPMEGYDCLKLGYVMEYLTNRISIYVC